MSKRPAKQMSMEQYKAMHAHMSAIDARWAKNDLTPDHRESVQHLVRLYLHFNHYENLMEDALAALKRGDAATAIRILQDEVSTDAPPENMQ